MSDQNRFASRRGINLYIFSVIILIILGLVFVVSAWTIPSQGLPGDSGPRALPVAATVLTVVLLLACLHPNQRLNSEVSVSQVRQTALLVASTIGFCLSMDILGYVIATTVYATLATFILGGRGLIKLTFYPVVLSLGTFVLFRYLLSVPLPVNSLIGAF